LTSVSVGTDTAFRLRRRRVEMLLTSQVSVTSWFFLFALAFFTGFELFRSAFALSAIVS